MALKSARLDRFLRKTLLVHRREVQALLASGRILVDHIPATQGDQLINAFSHITIEGTVLQARQPRYFMLNKPKGLLSATRDEHQQTIMSLLPAPEREGLHLAGRLDKNSTGLLLLSDDSRWTRVGMNPQEKVEKRYLVELRDPIVTQCIEAFAQGIYFEHEEIWTQPAHLELLAPCVARVILCEGRYHQIKRMFGRFRNPVLSLHRESIGALKLDPDLAPGQYRALRAEEVQNPVVCAAAVA